jgi:RNA polymerase sigma-70 factor (ECF subfamily)
VCRCSMQRAVTHFKCLCFILRNPTLDTNYRSRVHEEANLLRGRCAKPRDLSQEEDSPRRWWPGSRRESVLPKEPPRLGPDRRRRLFLLGDSDLIGCVVAGNPHAFGVLYDRHSHAAFSLAYRMMGERQESEDLVQEAFLKVWRSARSYRAERGSVRTWILYIVQNRGIDQLRSLASRRTMQEKVKASAPRSEPSEAFTQSWRNSQREQVREALKTLPPEQSKILELSYFYGHTQLEIARLLNTPLGTVKSRLRLGLKKIGEHFDRQAVATLS